MVDNKHPWKDLYEAAILETDGSKLQAKIDAAQSAIDARLSELEKHIQAATEEERLALSDALKVSKSCVANG